MVVSIELSEAKKAKIVFCYMWTLENGWRNLVLSHFSPFVNLMSDNDNHDMYIFKKYYLYTVILHKVDSVQTAFLSSNYFKYSQI